MKAPLSAEVENNVALMFYHLGYGFEIEGQYDDAIENFRLALQKNPDFSPAKLHLNELLKLRNS